MEISHSIHVAFEINCCIFQDSLQEKRREEKPGEQSKGSRHYSLTQRMLRITPNNGLSHFYIITGAGPGFGPVGGENSGLPNFADLVQQSDTSEASLQVHRVWGLP